MTTLAQPVHAVPDLPAVRPPRPLAPAILQPEVRGHIPVLDGSRGLAVSLVMLLHFTIIEPRTSLEMLFVRAAEVGWVGVDLFFVLSGFLITGILCDAKGKAGYFRNFYARRALRIFPVYYGYLLVLFLVLPSVLSPPPPGLRIVQDHQLWYWAYLTNFLVAMKQTYAATPFGTAHFWSLAVEEQFYLIWPAVALLLRRRSLMKLCAAVIAGSFALRLALLAFGLDTVVGYVVTPARIDALAAGAFVAVAAREPGGWATLARWSRPVILASGTVLVALCVWRRGFEYWDAPTQAIGYTPLALFFAALLVLVVKAPAEAWPARLLTSPLLTALGRYSYAIYVLHFPLVESVRTFFPEGSLPRVLGSQLPVQILLLPALGAVALGLGMLSWNLYEKHFLKLKRLFPY